MDELVDKILDNHSYKRKVIDNDGTPQVSLNEEGNKIVGIDNKAVVEMRYSEKHDWFYWVVYPPGTQPSPEQLEDIFGGD